MAEAPEDFDLEKTLCLLDEARAGDEKALELFCRRYLSSLQSWARSRLPTRSGGLAETDALVRETLLSALGRAEALEHLRAGTLLTHLRQAILDLDDGSPQVGAAVRIGGVPRDSSPIEDAVGRVTLNRYERALSGLEPKEREAVVARIEMGLDFGQIAPLLGARGPDEARSAVSEAVLRLARAMDVGSSARE